MAVPWGNPGAGDRSPSGERSGGAANLRTYAMVLAAVLLAYVVLHFVAIPGNRVVSFPVHHDDYNNLAHTRVALSSPFVRPVSTLALVLLSSAGITSYYLALHALTISYVFLTFVFVLEFLEIRSVRLIPLGTAALLVFSFEHLVDYYKYTGLITNLVSVNLGAAALVCLLRYCRGTGGLRTLLGGLVFSMGSLLAKEDFILAILLVPVAVAFERGGGSVWKRAALITTLVAGLAAAWFAFTVLVVQSAFVASRAGTYGSVFSPVSLAMTTARYLTFSRVSWAASAIQLFVLGLALFVRPRGSFRKILVLQALTFALVAPYACLPNHVYVYYCFNWLPLQAASLLILSAAGAPETWRSLKGVASGAALVSAIALAFWTHPERRQVVSWYAQKAALNEAIFDTLVREKDALNAQGVVGVTGAPFFNPWFATDGSFLVNRLGIRCRWVVFVEKGSDYYRTIVDLLSGTRRGLIETADLSDVARVRSLPVLALEPDGSGAVRPAVGPGIPEAHATLTATPRRAVVCDGSGLAVVSVSWSVPEGVAVEVHVGDPAGPLFSNRLGSGSADTGKWVTDGTVFYLQDASPGRPLSAASTLATATVHVTSEGCR
jgi:hypothetical protein